MLDDTHQASVNCLRHCAIIDRLLFRFAVARRNPVTSLSRVSDRRATLSLAWYRLPSAEVIAPGEPWCDARLHMPALQALSLHAVSRWCQRGSCAGLCRWRQFDASAKDVLHSRWACHALGAETLSPFANAGDRGAPISGKTGVFTRTLVNQATPMWGPTVHRR